MEVADSRMGSYTWKSILRGRDIIQRGKIWRIGSGEKINIWQQCWLPRKHPPWLLNCPLESFKNHTVDSLIDPVTRSWNEELVDGLFGVEDAEMIKKIPLSQSVAEDTLYWPYSTAGHYTCRFSYRFLKEESELLAHQKPHQSVIRRFGKRYGRCKSHRRLEILFGELVAMYCRPNKL